MKIRVASYNIRKCIGLDRRRDPARTLEAICDIGADIVALQEADRRFGLKHAAIPLDLIESQSPYRAVGFDVRPGGMGWHGNAILIRKEYEVVSAEPLALPTLEPRGAVMADIATDAGEVRIVGAHLDLSGLWRRRQVRAILNHMDLARPYHANVLMGDFNQWTRGGMMSEFAYHRHRAIDLPPSYHASRPVARLDRIIVSHDVDVTHSGVHLSSASRQASDHLPVYADLEIDAASGLKRAS